MSINDTTEVPDALYNRYRPRRLSELVGQDHVAVPLRRAFEKGRIHHAYLLSGPRGCGKTSTARILAAGLVCENGPTAEPCNTCDLCLAVIKGNAIDVIEMDAATHGRVDDARELREKAHFSPAIARFKVIVIDEAHMVTKEGFNALLKLIEEPPPHVRFIFATTDPDKVLPTIRSRTYHYSFRLVPAPALAAHLLKVVETEGATLEDGVLPLVLRAGGGSMRDSLAVLGQLLDGSDAGRVNLAEAAALLGTTADNILDNVVLELANRDTAGALTVIGEAIDSGTDPRRLGEDLLDRMRDLLLIASTGMLPPLAEIASADRQQAWRDAAGRLGVRGLTAACEVLQSAVGSMHSGQPRISLEVAAARILLSLADTVDVHGSLNALAQQVAALSAKVGTGLPEVYAAQSNATAQPIAAPDTAAPARPGVVQNPGGMIAGVDHDFGPGGQHSTPMAQIGTVTEETFTPAPAVPAEPAPAPVPAADTAEAAPTPAPAPASVLDGSEWDRLLSAANERRKITGALLRQHGHLVSLSNGQIVLSVPTPQLAETVRNGHAHVIADAATDLFGGTWAVEIQSAA